MNKKIIFLGLLFQIKAMALTPTQIEDLEGLKDAFDTVLSKADAVRNIEGMATPLNEVTRKIILLGHTIEGMIKK